MAFADWTAIVGTWKLDAVKKRTGASSVLHDNAGVGRLRHNTFSEAQAYVKFYGDSNWTNIGCVHGTYGTISATHGATGTWICYEVYLWYDAASNTKWGRIKKGGVQEGADTNFGAGAPAAGAIELYAADINTNIDDVEVYA